MKKALFISVYLLGAGSCFAQENIEHKKESCPKSALENIENVSYDCLDVWDSRLEKKIDEKYKIIYRRVKQKDMALHALPAYREQLCSDPTNNTDLKSASDWYILQCRIEQSQAHLKALERF